MQKIVKSETLSDNFLLIEAQALGDLKLELSDITDKTIRSEISEIIQNYYPRKLKTADFKLSILLNYETPVTCPPRRLALIEKYFIEKRISEWLEKYIIRKS